MLPAFFPKRMHTLGQVDIELRRRRGRRVGVLPQPDADGRRTWWEKIVEIGGLYHHTMTRTPDGWRSQKLHEEVVWKHNI